MAKKKWNIRSIFFEDDPAPKGSAKKPTASKTPPPPAAPSPSPEPAPAAPAADGGGAVSDRFVKVLMEAMEAANLPGFDYLEYKKALQNLKKMNFTDDVRYQTAYAAAQGMGVTPQQLVGSAQHYLNTLAAEQAKFAQALSGQRGQQVGDKEKQLQQLDADIARQEAKIKELQEAIAKTKSRQQKLKKDITNSTAKLARTEADFRETYRVLTEGIQRDVDNMKQYLK